MYYVVLNVHSKTKSSKNFHLLGNPGGCSPRKCKSLCIHTHAMYTNGIMHEPHMDEVRSSQDDPPSKNIGVQVGTILLSTTQ